MALKEKLFFSLQLFGDFQITPTPNPQNIDTIFRFMKLKVTNSNYARVSNECGSRIKLRRLKNNKSLFYWTHMMCFSKWFALDFSFGPPHIVTSSLNSE